MTFGDFDLDDAYSNEGAPDVEQFAIRIHQIRSALLELGGHDPLPPWWVYVHQTSEIAAAALVVPILTATINPVLLAQRIHEARRAEADPSLEPWDDLSVEAIDIAIAIARNLLAWLIRQGALR